MEIFKSIRKRTPTTLKRLVRCTVLPGNAGRNLTIKDDDTFIVSYPKSGNTWTRFLLGNLFHKGGNISFANIESKVPDIYKNSDRTLLKIASPRLLKSHEYFDPRYRRVIYIVRDPRDVAVSYYHYLIKTHVFDDNYPIELFCERFMRGEWDPFGSWGENVGSWIGAKVDGKEFLLLRYEDMLIDTVKEVKKVAAFLGVQASSTEVEHTVAMSSFGRMRELESRQSEEWAGTRASRADKFFVRSGKAGSWHTHLPKKASDRIADEWGELMEKLDYSCEY